MSWREYNQSHTCNLCIVMPIHHTNLQRKSCMFSIKTALLVFLVAVIFPSLSLDRITLALQTAARLSQQAELGGILEEIEVSFTTPAGGAVS